MAMTVAVVVRTAGDRELLARALRSIRAQTHPGTAVVLALDTAADASAVEALAAEDPRLVVVRGTGRGGLANAALAAVDTDLVVLHDDDGWWRQSFLEETLAFLESHPDHVAVACRAEVVHADGITRELLAAHEPAVSLTSLLVHNYVPPVSLLFRRTAAEDVGRYDQDLPALEDWEFLLRLVAHGPVGLLPGEPLAAWSAGPPADRDTQRAAELQVRDRVLRHDLTGKEPGTGGLGMLLALTDQLSAATDRWGRAHQDHLDAVTTEQRLELGRMRGEMLLMRELLTELQDDIAVLGSQVEESLTRTGRAGRGGAEAGGPVAAAGLARRLVQRTPALGRARRAARRLVRRSRG